GVRPDRELAALGGEHRPLDADDVADVEREQALVGVVAELVDPGLYLELAGAVLEVEEGRLAVTAPSREPARDAIAVIGLLARLEPLVCLANGGDLGSIRKAVRERLDALLAQALQLGSTVGEQVGLFGHAGSLFPPSPSGRGSQRPLRKSRSS